MAEHVEELNAKLKNAETNNTEPKDVEPKDVEPKDAEPKDAKLLVVKYNVASLGEIKLCLAPLPSS